MQLCKVKSNYDVPTLFSCVKLDVLQEEPGLDLSQINNMTQDQREILAPSCVSCILSKLLKLFKNKTNKIIGEHITKPKDVIHMGQALV